MTRRNLRVLVVDDEPDVCEMIEDVLSDYDVSVANTYDAARSELASQTFDAVILDIMGVNGLQLLARFGGRFPCIVLTAHALTAESFKEAMGDRARLFLPKDEIGRLDEHVDRVIRANAPLWHWLVEEVDFSQWFGPDWHPDEVLAEIPPDEASES